MSEVFSYRAVKKESSEPFREPLWDAGYDSDYLREIKSRPELLVRFFPFALNLSSDNALEKFRRGDKILHEFCWRHGIALPHVRHAVGESNQERGVYTVVDRIEGSSLNKTSSHLLEQARPQIDSLFDKIIRYYADIYRNGGDYWNDFLPEQVVYGRKPGEKSQRLYLVDVDPFYASYNPESPKDGHGELPRTFRRIARSIIQVEERLPSTEKFERAREELGRFLETVPESDPYFKIFKETKEEIMPPVGAEAAG